MDMLTLSRKVRRPRPWGSAAEVQREDGRDFGEHAADVANVRGGKTGKILNFKFFQLLIFVDICQAGTKTLMSLDDQAEQLDNIEGNLDKINNDMAESEKAIKDMDRAFGIIPKFWKKNDGFKEDKETWAEAKPSKGFEKAEALEIREGAYVAKITDDDREEEMEENMEQVYVLCPVSKIILMIVLSGLKRILVSSRDLNQYFTHPSRTNFDQKKQIVH